MFSPGAFWNAKRVIPNLESVQPPKRLKIISPPVPPSTTNPPLPIINHDRLSKYILLSSSSLAASSSWYEFVDKQRGPSDLQPYISSIITHPAAQLLTQVAQHGVPILLSSLPWSRSQLDAAMQRGSHPSTLEHYIFLRNEMADMVEQQQWIVIPYDQALLLPNLCLSPMGVVPQRDRRPRIIVDFTFSGVNLHTLTSLAPLESMQFGQALDRVLYKIHHANRHFGPVHMIKVDIADGFYRIRVSASHMPTLGVAFPSGPGEPPLVAIPLVLPMGWVSSPPFFCMATETAADIANQFLSFSMLHPPPHPLCQVADTPSNFQPVSRYLPVPATAPISTASHAKPQLLIAPFHAQPLPAPSLLPYASSFSWPLIDSPTPPQPPTVVSIPPNFSSVPLPPVRSQPNQRYLPSIPLAYVDLYMDDFLGLAQGHPGLRERVRSTLFHSIDKIFRPLGPMDDHTSRREPISISKLNKGDAKWATRKCLLGWIIDTVRETIELPEHRRLRLLSILADLLTKRRVSLKTWQQSLGELRSMVLALPGGRGLFSSLYTGLTQSSTSDSRIRITTPIRDSLLDLQHLASDLAARPTRIGEVVDTLPVAYSAADACGLGMGGIWLSPDPMFTPLLWRSPFDPSVIPCLVTSQNRTGSITNSDLELAAQIATQAILLDVRSCVETTISTFTDNISARAWLRKGSKTTHGPAAYLLRIQSLLQRHFRYRSTVDYVPGPTNTMADDASRLWHLSDTALLTHFNSVYPQDKPWTLCHLTPEMHSALTMALLCKRSLPGLFLPDPNLVQPPGFYGPITVPPTTLTPSSPMWLTPFPSSKCLPNVTALAPLPPIKVLSDLVPWKRPSAPLARRWPAWGPQIHV
jgi:hypothetical protein